MPEGNSIYADVSTFPRASATPYDPLGTIGKLQGIEANSIGIDRSKLQLMNERYQIVNKNFATLLNDPNINSEKIVDEAQNLYKLGLIPTSEALAEHISQIPSIEGIKRNNPNATPEQVNALHKQALHGWLEQKALKAEDNHNAVNFMYGTPGIVDTGQVQQGIVSSPKFGVQPRGGSFQNQPPVGMPVATSQGTQALGPQPQVPPQGGSAFIPNRGQTVPAPRLPIRPGEPALGEPATPAERVAQGFNSITPRGPMLSQPPSFEEGKRQYSEDINQASQTLQALKPAQQALKLMDPEVIKGLTGTGPIAEKATKLLSALQGVGILDTSEPVAARQELTKKLAQYVSNNPIGQRSDAAQTLKEAGSPNPNVQVLPALINLTRDAIALDRVNAAKALAFNNKDFSQYLPHKGSFANSIDERAFKLDIMPADEREKLRQQVKKESKMKQDKFLTSVELAKRLKMYE